MLKAFAAALLIVAAPAMAQTYDPCITESRMTGEVARARDSGERMVDLLRSVSGQFADDAEEELYLRMVALAYGNPEMSASLLEEAMLQACYDEQ